MANDLATSGQAETSSRAERKLPPSVSPRDALKLAVSCAGEDGTASGPDRVYKVAVPRRTHVHIELESSSFEAAIALRKSCGDASGGASAAELVCEASDTDGGQPTILDRVLEAGTYWVVVDGKTPNDQGSFTLRYRTAQ